MGKPLLLALLCLSALLAGCKSPGPLDPSAPLDVSVASRTIRLENQSSRTIYYSILTTELAARALWGPCTRPDEGCASLEPHARAEVPYSRIAGYERRSREALLRWWHLVERSDGGWPVDEVRQVRIRL